MYTFININNSFIMDNRHLFTDDVKYNSKVLSILLDKEIKFVDDRNIIFEEMLKQEEYECASFQHNIVLHFRIVLIDKVARLMVFDTDYTSSKLYFSVLIEE